MTLSARAERFSMVGSYDDEPPRDIFHHVACLPCQNQGTNSDSISACHMWSTETMYASSESDIFRKRRNGQSFGAYQKNAFHGTPAHGISEYLEKLHLLTTDNVKVQLKTSFKWLLPSSTETNKIIVSDDNQADIWSRVASGTFGIALEVFRWPQFRSCHPRSRGRKRQNTHIRLGR